MTSVWSMGGNKMCSAHRFGSPYPSRMHCGLKALRAHHSHHKHCGLLPCVRASLFFSEGTTSDKSPARDPSPAGARPAGIKRCGHRHPACAVALRIQKMRCGHIGPARLGEAALEGGPDTLAPQPHAAYTPPPTSVRAGRLPTRRLSPTPTRPPRLATSTTSRWGTQGRRRPPMETTARRDPQWPPPRTSTPSARRRARFATRSRLAPRRKPSSESMRATPSTGRSTLGATPEIRRRGQPRSPPTSRRQKGRPTHFLRPRPSTGTS